jgi:hypothetical protein
MKNIFNLFFFNLLIPFFASSQIRQSYSEITKENGLNFKTIYDNTGFKTITYTDNGQGKRFEFIETDNVFICFAYMYVEPINKANDFIKLYDKYFVKINDLEWKDYAKNIIYELSFTKERDAVKVKATIDNRNESKKHFSLTETILNAKSITEIEACVIISFEKGKYGKEYSRDNLSYFDIYRINGDLDNIASWLNYNTFNDQINKVSFFVPNKLTKILNTKLISNLIKISTEEKWTYYKKNKLNLKITKGKNEWIIDITE